MSSRSAKRHTRAFREGLELALFAEKAVTSGLYVMRSEKIGKPQPWWVRLALTGRTAR